MRLFDFKGLMLVLVLIFNAPASISFASERLKPPLLIEKYFDFPRCPNIDNSIFLIEPNVQCETLNLVLSIHQEIQKISPLPFPLSRILVYKYVSTHSVTMDNLVTLVEAKDINQTSEQRNIIWIHEMGHVIFHTLLKKDFDEFRKLAKKGMENSNKVWNSFNNYKRPSTPAANPDQNLEIFFDPYNELFADFVTAVYTNNLDSTYSTFDKNNSSNKFLEKAKRLSFLNQNQDGICDETDQHFYFSFSRPVIGKKFLINIASTEEKKKAILNFYQFISKEWIENWKKYGSKIECEKANRELIEKLNSNSTF